eukprot:GHVS01056367.1.p1 GENE.GHVS01056367.1~~GHVS01056367.1.p1  ORF type:complete len:966 (+),score=131.78 GHVS01056367.1:425-2899(+)
MFGRKIEALKDNAAQLKEKLNSHLQGSRLSVTGSPVVDVSLVYKESLTDFKPCDQTYSPPYPTATAEASTANESPKLCLSPFFKIYLQLPKQVGVCRNYLQNSGDSLYDGNGEQLLGGCGVYEGNVPVELRYMVDNDITGCAWIEVDISACSTRDSSSRSSHCQFEADIFYEDITAHQPEGCWQDIPPLRILSFDIECVKMQGCGFPVAQEDPVIQISSVMQLQGSNDLYFKTIFALDECAPIAGAHVFWFRHEADLLLKWSEFIRRTDPDILTGYNCINFDTFYLLSRAETLKLNGFDKLSRLIYSRSSVKDSVISSKAMGTHENKQINIEGRIQLDVMDAVRRDHKLKSYTLNNVSFAFLQEQKEDVHYSSIRDLQCGNPETRRRVAVYCIKDSYLPLRLIDKLLLIYNYVEMARVTGCPIPFLLTRGQQIRVTSQLLRQAKPLNFIVPSKRPSNQAADEQYTGATVLDPKKGFYQKPIATLDFASLYPSIIMAHNLCYTTLVQPHLKQKLRPEDVTETTTSPKYYFVKPHVRKGVLPLILQNLIAARKKAKKQMSIETDPFKKNVYNGRQLALKITANSVYGFTGATTGGQLPCLEIATSTTCYGRDMIEITKNFVQSHYSTSNGYPYNAVVVYGDTDSVMVDFTHNKLTDEVDSGGTDNEVVMTNNNNKPTTAADRAEEVGMSKAQIVARRLPLSVAETMKMGREAADWISDKFVSPIKLEFEKVYFPFLLMNKKRYAGVIYTTPEKFDRKDCKGIETVRRDFCPLLQRLVDNVLDKMLIDFDVVGAQQLTKDSIADLLQNKIDMSLLVVTKSIGLVITA